MEINTVTSDTETKILQWLEAWEQDGIELPPIFGAYRRLLQLQIEAKAHLGQPQLDKAKVARRLSEGNPALSFADLAIDWALVRGLLEAAGPILAEQAVLPSREVEHISAIVGDSALVQAMAQAWFEGSSLASAAAAHNINEGLISAAMGVAFKPLLSTYRDAIVPSLGQELWRRRICPVCGGLPDFAYLERENRSRWLMCSRCDACWLFQRLQCPYCGNQDQPSLAYYTNDEESFRLYVCDKCRHYIKAIDLNRAKGEVPLPLERPLTVSLDDEALATGYTPGLKLWPPPVAAPIEEDGP